jgi:hypothetical protein
MTTDVLVVPYGSGRVPATITAALCATIDRARRRPLRLNDGGYAFDGPAPPAPPNDSAAMLALLRDHLAGLCDPWATHQRRFIERYFAFVAWRVASLAEPLAARLAPFGDLYRVEDFSFSALRPLPRAHLRRADGAGWVATDVAFWTGDGLVVLDIADQRRTRRQRAADHEQLRAAGATVVELPPDKLVGNLAELAALLPPALVRFCDDAALPSGPFKSTALGDIVDAGAGSD